MKSMFRQYNKTSCCLSLTKGDKIKPSTSFNSNYVSNINKTKETKALLCCLPPFIGVRTHNLKPQSNKILTIPQCLSRTRGNLLNEEHDIRNFLTYIRTLQQFKIRIRDNNYLCPVYIKNSIIYNEFFPYYTHSEIKTLLHTLEMREELRISQKTSKNGHTMFLYETLKDGRVDLDMIPIQTIPNNQTLIYMRECLKKVSIIKGSISTNYFDHFQKHVHNRPDLFFKVCEFGKRIHTPISSFHRELRRNILIDQKISDSIDVSTMQPLLLGKILRSTIGDNQFSDWIDNGLDIYVQLQGIAKLASREQAKKLFYKITFGKPSNELVYLFGQQNWIEWINYYKTTIQPKNPSNKIKPHSNLAWLLQRQEVCIMYKVWKKLAEIKTPFLTVHDEIIIQTQHYQTTKKIMHEIFNKEFIYYKFK